jgi:hypothetical protein
MNKRGLLLAVCASVLAAAALCGCSSSPDVPEDSRLLFYGPVDHPDDIQAMLPVDEGMPARSVYIYDDDDGKVVAVRTVDAHHRDLNFVWRSDHKYRIYIN